MYKVVVRLDKNRCPVLIKAGLINQSGKLIYTSLKRSCRVAVVTDRNVGRLYGGVIIRSLKNAGFTPKIITVTAGEASKSFDKLNHLYKEFLSHRIERSSAIVALGGGVIGDLAGFAAATFMRGIDFIQISTSLLAQVDSSVGGKVAVNLPLPKEVTQVGTASGSRSKISWASSFGKGKNLAGAFYQPRLVIIDPLVLKTLPKPEFINGMAEVIKIALIRSPALTAFLQNHVSEIIGLDISLLEKMIYQSVSLKTEIVQQDEREKRLRMILNYGHTIGHVIETLDRYRHGEAISIGMICAAYIARQMGLVKPDFVRQQSDLLAKYGLPVKLNKHTKLSVIISRLRFDKKARNGRTQFVLPLKIGRVIVSDRVNRLMIQNSLAQRQPRWKRDKLRPDLIGTEKGRKICLQ